MLRSFQLFAAVLLVLPAFASPAAPPDDLPELTVPGRATQAQRIEAIDQWLGRIHREHKFNGGVLVARRGRPLLMRAYGVTDHTGKELLTTKSAMRLGSVSKQFTAAGLLVLAEKGRLSLDHPVAQYLEELPYKQATIRQLLNHTSGIPDVYMKLAASHREDFGDVLRISDVPKLLAKYHPKAKSPGEEYSYSNTGYVLAAAVIERVMGQMYQKVMQNELFRPLGMEQTGVWTLLSTAPFPNRAKDFRQVGPRREAIKPTWMDGIAGDGAVFCSLEDFLIWDEFWRGNRLVSPQRMAAAFTPAQLSGGKSTEYGLGWRLGKGTVSHGGKWLGANTSIVRWPKQRALLVVLDNSLNERVDAITHQIRTGFQGMLSAQDED